jgi:hypothetical protein
MMATTNTMLTITVKFAWWLPPYLNTVVMLCRLFNAEPNMERVSYWIGKGIRVKA